MEKHIQGFYSLHAIYGKHKVHFVLKAHKTPTNVYILTNKAIIGLEQIFL